MTNTNGHAATLNPWKSCESGNRAGAPPGKRVTLRFCRARSLAMAKVLVAVAEDVDAPPAARVGTPSWLDLPASWLTQHQDDDRCPQSTREPERE